VPLLARAPGLIPNGRPIAPMVQNIDIAPTLLEAAGAPLPAEMKMDGLLPGRTAGGSVVFFLD
jgi:arylsulfatase A-like enzyme